MNGVNGSTATIDADIFGAIIAAINALSHSLFRHPGESRDPDYQLAHRRKVWVPTYFGMTKNEKFTGMAEHSLDLQRALEGSETQKDVCIR
jgi:hypothetical protein